MRVFLAVFSLFFIMLVEAEESLYREDMQRIISLAPSITASVSFFEAEENLVGVTSFCKKYLRYKKNVPCVGNLFYPNLEKIFLLRPTCILHSQFIRYAWPRKFYTKTKIQLLKMENLHDVIVSLKFLGNVMQKKSLFFRWQEALEATSRIEKSLGVLFFFGVNKTFSAGKGSYVHELLDYLGVKNLAASSHSKWPCLTKEFILNTHPDIVIIAVNKKSMLSSGYLKFYRDDPFWKTLDAVNNGRLFFVDEEAFLVPGPSGLNALQVLKDCLELGKRD